jgi:heme-degrading monooxygenase HmoA
MGGAMSTPGFADTLQAPSPQAPYYAVIFTSLRHADGADLSGMPDYGATADRMVELAQQQPGFLGVESARGEDRLGITVSYWRSEADIQAWKAHAEHRIAQETGQARWYEHYVTRVAKVERAYAGPR